MSDFYAASLTLTPGSLVYGSSIEAEFTSVEVAFTGLEVEVDQAVRFSGGGFATTPVVISDAAAARANTVLRFNSDGDTLELHVIADTASVTTPIAVANGGTGATTAAGARTNLSITPSDWDYVTKVTTAGSQATVEFTNLTDDYDHMFMFRFCQPATDDVRLQMRTSADGGSNWDDGVSDYQWHVYGRQQADTNTEVNGAHDANDTLGRLTVNGVGSGTDEKLNGEIYVFGMGNANHWPVVNGDLRYVDAAAGLNVDTANVIRKDGTNNTFDSVQFYWASGNWANGGQIHHYRRPVAS